MRPFSPHVGFSDLCYHLAGFLQCLGMKTKGNYVKLRTLNYWGGGCTVSVSSSECPLMKHFPFIDTLDFCVPYTPSKYYNFNNGNQRQKDRMSLSGFTMLYVKKYMCVCMANMKY